jgi:hypothetical protein
MKKLIMLLTLTTMIIGCGKNETGGAAAANTTTTYNANTQGNTTTTGAEAITRRNEVQAEMNAVSVIGGITTQSELYFSEGSGFANGYQATLSRRYKVTAVSGSSINYDYEKRKLLCLNWFGNDCTEILDLRVYNASSKSSDMTQVFSDSNRQLQSVTSYAQTISGVGYTCHDIDYTANNGSYTYTVCPGLPALANPARILEKVSGGEVRILNDIQ